MRVKDLLLCGWGSPVVWVWISLFISGGFSRLPQYLFVDSRATTSFLRPPEPGSRSPLARQRRIARSGASG